MKAQIFAFLFLFLSANVFAMDVSVYPAVFYEGDQGYVEMHYYFSGQSIGWKSVEDSLMNASAEVLITFSQGKTILKYDKYNLHSPKFSLAKDFRDVHRYSLKPGKYQVEIKIEDGSRTGNGVKFKTSITISPPRKAAVSDIVLLSAHYASDKSTDFEKYGFHMESLPYNFVSSEQKSVVIYAEIYNTNLLSKENYSLRLQFESVDEHGNKKPYQGFTKKRKAMEKDIYFRKIDMQRMPSGDYNVVLEVRDEAGLVVAHKSVGFHRDNPRLSGGTTIADLNGKKGNFIEKLSEKDIDYYLSAMIPILNGKKLNTLQAYFKSKNLEGKKQFLYSYFVKKDPINPAEPFYAFASLARKVDDKFYNAFGAGFETDRGRIFMKYGEPNDFVKVENEQYALPYEIWVYEHLPNGGSGPIKFLFYNRDQAGENFTLLHCNAKDERQNRNWKLELFRKDTVSGLDYSDNRMKSDEIDSAFNAHPNSMAIRYFQDL